MAYHGACRAGWLASLRGRHHIQRHQLLGSQIDLRCRREVALLLLRHMCLPSSCPSPLNLIWADSPYGRVHFRFARHGHHVRRPLPRARLQHALPTPGLTWASAAATSSPSPTPRQLINRIGSAPAVDAIKPIRRPLRLHDGPFRVSILTHGDIAYLPLGILRNQPQAIALNVVGPEPHDCEQTLQTQRSASSASRRAVLSRSMLMTNDLMDLC